MRSKWQSIAIAGLVVLLTGPALWVWGRGTIQARSAPKRAEGIAKAHPKAVVDKPTHRFGYLDPAERCEHVFVIRNAGAAPLELSRGTTSCKCTMSDIPDAPIAPGGEVGVRVASKIEQKEGAFSHSATVFTNDPQNPAIRLRIQGEVRKHIGAYPSRIVAAGMDRGESHTAELTVYSQVWEEFEIGDIQTSLEGLSWKLVGAADPAVLEKLDAKSGQRIVVTIPGQTSGTDFWERLELAAAPSDQANARRLIVDISGSVLARVELTGAKLDGMHRVVRLGALRDGEGASERLMLIVRDEHRDLKIDEIETDPPFLKVHVTPHEQRGGGAKLYFIALEVPADAPACNYLTEKGTVRITTDHPVVPHIDFEVAFAIASQP